MRTPYYIYIHTRGLLNGFRIRRQLGHLILPAIMLIGLFAVSACNGDSTGSDEPAPQPQQAAIGFSPSVTAETRAGINYGDRDINTLNNSGFGVFCYYSGKDNYAATQAPDAQDVVMNNVKVSRPDGAIAEWTYTPRRFWPASGNKLSFFVYAPYMGEASVKTGEVPGSTYSADGSNGNKMVLTSYRDNGVYYPAINYYATNILADQNDLLWGTDDRGLPFVNQDVKDHTNGHLYLQMCHALARLQLYITSAEDYQSQPVGNPPQGWRNYTAETRLLVKRVTFNNQYGQGTLVLNNTYTFRPRWVNKTGVNGTDGNWLSFDLTSDLNPAINGNDDNLDDEWANHTGVQKDTINLLKNGGSIMVIPKMKEDLNGTMQHTAFTVVSQRVTRWVNNATDEVILVRGDEVSRTATLADGQDLLGTHSYRVNLNIEAKYLDLTLQVQPWTLEETVYDDTNKPVTITVPSNGKLTWLKTENYDIDDRDSLSHGLVYVNSHYAAATFQITAPQGATWTASLVPVMGHDNAFAFTDDKGNVISAPTGNVGVGESNLGRIYLRANSLTTPVENRAVLRFYVTTAGGQTAIVRNLTPDNATGFTEYQVVQRVNQ